MSETERSACLACDNGQHDRCSGYTWPLETYRCSCCGYPPD